MEWLTEYFEVLLPIALVLFFVLRQFLGQEEGESGPRPGQSEADDEARRIQEEIRRKIIARQQGRSEESGESGDEAVAYREEAPPQQREDRFPRRQETPPPIRAESLERPSARTAERPPPVRRSQSERRSKPEAKAAGKARDLQDELRVQMERLRESREAKEEAVKSSSAKGLHRRGKTKRAVVARAHEDVRSQLLADLSTGDSMKRAFLLKEVVDRPIGLRSRPDVFSNWS